MEEDLWSPVPGAGCPIGLIGNDYLGKEMRRSLSLLQRRICPVATFWCVYCGRLVDTDNPKTVSASDGTGRGIFPMLTSFMVKFLHAEMALTTSVEGDPLSLLQEGIGFSMEKVRDFGATEMPSISGSEYEMSDEAIAAYIADVSSQYQAAETEAERLNIIITEYQLALWGNGIEAYNNYRRTGFPDFAETSPVMGNPPYPRRFIIPVSELETNPALSDYSPDPFESVFWSQP